MREFDPSLIRYLLMNSTPYLGDHFIEEGKLLLWGQEVGDVVKSMRKGLHFILFQPRKSIALSVHRVL
jgi:hypothetical protein